MELTDCIFIENLIWYCRVFYWIYAMPICDGKIALLKRNEFIGFVAQETLKGLTSWCCAQKEETNVYGSLSDSPFGFDKEFSPDRLYLFQELVKVHTWNVTRFFFLPFILMNFLFFFFKLNISFRSYCLR